MKGVIAVLLFAFVAFAMPSTAFASYQDGDGIEQLHKQSQVAIADDAKTISQKFEVSQVALNSPDFVLTADWTIYPLFVSRFTLQAITKVSNEMFKPPTDRWRSC